MWTICGCCVAGHFEHQSLQRGRLCGVLRRQSGGGPRRDAEAERSDRRLADKAAGAATTRPTPRCEGGRRAPRSSGRRAGALTSAKAGLLFGRTPGLPCSFPWRPARAGRALVSAAPGRAPAASCGHVGHRQRWQAVVAGKLLQKLLTGGLAREPTGCLNKGEFNIVLGVGPTQAGVIFFSCEPAWAAKLSLRTSMYLLPSILGSERFHHEFDLSSLILVGWFGCGSNSRSGGMGWAKRSGASRTPSTWAGAAL